MSSSSPDRPCADDTPSHPVCAGVLRNAMDLAQKLMVYELHWCPPPPDGSEYSLPRQVVELKGMLTLPSAREDPRVETQGHVPSRDEVVCAAKSPGGIVVTSPVAIFLMAPCQQSMVHTRVSVHATAAGSLLRWRAPRRSLRGTAPLPTTLFLCWPLTRIARRIAWHERKASGHLPKPRRSGPTFRSTVAGHPELRPPRHEPQADDSWPWSTLPLSSASVPSS